MVEMAVQFVGALEVGQDHGSRASGLKEYRRVTVGPVVCEIQRGFAVYFDQEQLRGCAPKDLGGDLVVAARVEFNVRTGEEFVGQEPSVLGRQEVGSPVWVMRPKACRANCFAVSGV